MKEEILINEWLVDNRSRHLAFRGKLKWRIVLAVVLASSVVLIYLYYHNLYATLGLNSITMIYMFTLLCEASEQRGRALAEKEIVKLLFNLQLLKEVSDGTQIQND